MNIKGKILAIFAAALFFSAPVPAQELLSPTPVLHFDDGNGAPLSGGKLFTYQAGTTTKQNTFISSDGLTPNTNPVILNSRGEANVWLDPAKTYKFILSPPTDTDPPTNPIYTVDNISTGNVSIFSGSCVTGSSAIASGVETLCVKATAANTQTLPSSPALWERHTIVDSSGNAATNNITVSGNGNNINGQPSYTIAFDSGSISVQWNGTQWVGTASANFGLDVGSLVNSTIGNITLARPDAQRELQNVGNSHALMSIFNTYKPCSGTPIATFVAGNSGTTLTVSSGPTLMTGNIVCGNIGSWGSVVRGTTITAGSGPTYTVSKSQTISAATTLYEYPAPQEASLGLFGYNNTPTSQELVTLNGTWANNDDSSNSVACLATLTAGGTELCNLLAFADTGVIIGSNLAGGNYVSPGANVTQIYQTLITRGAVSIGTAANAPQANITAIAGQNAVFDFIRPGTAQASVIRMWTGATHNWDFGLDPIGHGNGDLLIYDPQNTAFPLVVQATTDFIGISQNNPTANLDNGGTTLLEGAVTMSGLTADTALTTRTVCQKTSDNHLYYGSGTAGVCVGTSTLSAKDNVQPLPWLEAVTRILRSQPVSFHYNKASGMEISRQQYGFIAEWMGAAFPELVGHDINGNPNSFDMLGMFAWLVRGFQVLVIWNILLTWSCLGLLFLHFRRR